MPEEVTGIFRSAPSVRRIAAAAAGSATMIGFLVPDARLHSTAPAKVAWFLTVIGLAIAVPVLAASLGRVALGSRSDRRPRDWTAIYLLIHLFLGAVGMIALAVIDSAIDPQQGLVIDPQGVVAGALSVAAFGLFVRAVAVAHTRMVHQERESRARAASAEQAHNTLISVDENRRREVSTHLHGHIQTRLLAIEFQLRQLASSHVGSPDYEKLGRLADDVERLRDQDVRALSHVVHPAGLGIGIVPSLNALSAQFFTDFGVDVSVHVDERIARFDAPGGSGLASSVRLTLYRATEEALNNAHRHGRARTITIRLIEDVADRLVLEIADDGCGIDGSSHEPGFGLTTLGLRLAAHGGTCTLAPSESGGAMFRATVHIRAGELDGHVRPESPGAEASHRGAPALVTSPPQRSLQ